MNIRGDSGSGKTTTAREVRRRYGRGCALIELDQFRRVVLREHGGLDAVAPGFIGMSARYLLSTGYHAIVEGILRTRSYGTVLRQPIAEHPGPSHVYYLDVSFEEAIRRHHNRAEPIPVSAEEMRGRYVALDTLGVPAEHVIPETSTFEQTVATILDTSGLAGMAPATPCPTRCARCAQKRTEDRNAMPATTGRHDEDGPDDVYVQDVAVHPAHRRRRSVAGALVSSVATQARLWGCHRLWFTCAPGNTPAIATRRRLGLRNLPRNYTVDGIQVIADCKGPGRDRPVFELDLPATGPVAEGAHT
ncbi:hypothetical protein GCM10010170_048810 [Dactylosporangium salmoneum]|uniref:N-acetyltransferase domain-containing protein n=1 Tax=Dactylosporangium salmoneum TaxID=53361 RepID=A0ABP5TN84_9ACTN